MPDYYAAQDIRDAQPKITSSTLTDGQLEAQRDDLVQPDVDSMLSREWDVPFSAAHPIIKALSVQLGVYYAMTSKWGSVGPGTESTVARSHKERADILVKELLDGKRDVVDSSGDIVARKADRVLTESDISTKPSTEIFVGDEPTWAHPTETRSS